MRRFRLLAPMHWTTLRLLIGRLASERNLRSIAPAASLRRWRGTARSTRGSAHHLRYAFEAAEVLLDGATRNRTLTRLRSMLDRAEFFVAEAPVARYGLTPLHFVPTRETTARRVFDDALIERHLDDLGACQNDDGGWPIRFDPPSDGARIEWRGNWTLEALMTLRAWGRL